MTTDLKTREDFSIGSILSETNNDLKGNWGIAIVGIFLSIIVFTVLGLVPFGSFLFGGVYMIGLCVISLNIVRQKEIKVGDVFDGFNQFGVSLASFFLMFLGVFIGILFFIFPGIIVALALSQTFYILAEDKEITALDALKKSNEMMKGHKIQLFLLHLVLGAIAFLCLIFTLGIGLIWFIPFAQVCLAKFYQKLKGENEVLTLEDNLIV